MRLDGDHHAGAGRSISLKAVIEGGGPVIAPGIYDSFTAHLAAQAGFGALYLSGAAIAYTRLGRPDIGLVSMTEVSEVVSLVCDRVDLPLIVDGDTGFGNALNTQRTVRSFERAGAAAIQIEDQTFPKRCGHLSGKSVIPKSEMAGKIRAAVDARRSEGFAIIARTDALAVEGINAALDRANLYAEAGADLLFVEAPRSREQLARIADALKGVAPLVANMVEGGDTPILSGAELGHLGFALTLFPGGIVRALGFAARDYFNALQTFGTTTPFRDRMVDLTELNGLIGTSDMIARGERYEGLRGAHDDR